MPIYEYRCSTCGFQKEHLQKMSDPHLSQCPGCGADAYQRQLSAAGFQLKGSGWYATDFKGASCPVAEQKSPDKPATPPCGGACACH